MSIMKCKNSRCYSKERLYFNSSFLSDVLPHIRKCIMKHFVALFHFLISVSPLRWEIFGSAILAASLALAGTAWSLDLPDVLCFNLFGALYWVFIYISIYIEISGGVYERTKELIKKTWLFRKMKKAFTLERQTIVFFLHNCYVISCFGILVFSYNLMFPEIEKGNLVNPLQVIAQLSCFFFNFKYPVKPVRVRHLLLLCFFLSLLSSLHLQGVDWEILSLVFLFFLIIKYFFSLDYANLIIFCGYFLDQGLAKWAFYLAFQQVGHYALTFLLEKKQSSSIPKKRCLSFILLIIIQFFFGLFYYEDFYFKEPLKLAALLSGACIIFICLSKRTKWSFRIAFLFYFIISLVIGLKSAPMEKTTILGIPDGILIFVFVHLLFFLGWLFFKDSLPRRKQPLVPLFFSGIFLLLGYFPELAWLEKWIEGIDLLLLILGVFSFVEDEKSIQRRMRLKRLKTTLPRFRIKRFFRRQIRRSIQSKSMKRKSKMEEGVVDLPIVQQVNKADAMNSNNLSGRTEYSTGIRDPPLEERKENS